LLLGRVYDDKDVQEWIVRRSKLDWADRASRDPDRWAEERLSRVGRSTRLELRVFISRADVADFLVKQIDDDTFLHKTPVLTSSLPISRSEPTRPPHRRAA